MPLRRWLAIGATVVALAVCYGRAVAGMVNQWWTDEDMGHGFVVPLVIVWIVWKERTRWSKLAIEPSAWGITILIAAALLQLAGSAGAGLFAASLAFLLSIAGAIVCLNGFAWLRAWSFPLILALFILPKLAIVYNQATLPMQLLASKMAAGMLTAAGAAVIRDGNILDVGGHRVLVAEACNGLRMVFALIMVGFAFCFAMPLKNYVRAIILLLSPLAAIICNAVRVTSTIWMYGYMPEHAQQFHVYAGWAMLPLAFAMLYGLIKTLQWAMIPVNAYTLASQ